MAEFNGFRLVLQLEAQMPLIHFQSAQCGATLRATEMKPKLDAFLLAKLEKETGKSVAELKNSSEYGSLFLNGDAANNDALDYKLQITAEEAPIEIELNNNLKEGFEYPENYSLFYGNMGASPDKKKYGIFSDPTVTVLCFKETLRQLIQENIVKFFLVTNFGTMQDKGFGSFIPKDWCKTRALSEGKKEEVAKAYREMIPNGKCYAMVFPNMPVDSASFQTKNRFCVKKAEAIKCFYSIMKSGINFRGYSRSYIYQYGHEVLDLGNEKAWMKKNGIAPIVFKPENEKKHEYGGQNYRYLRAFLGTGEHIEYGNKIVDNKIKKDPKITVDIKSQEFERVPSPIYFKVIRNVVFVVAFDVPEELYGVRFSFSSSISGGSKTISVPTREELKTNNQFDIQDFLSKYVTYYNGKLREKVKHINDEKYPKVLEVKINA